MRPRLALLSAAFALLSAAPARAERVLVAVVADGSQNMWRQSKGTFLVSILRSGLKKAHAGLPEGAELGVRAYGIENDAGVSRRILPIGRHKESEVAAAVQAMNPKGKVELLVALREVEKDFEGLDGKRVVFLLASGADQTVRDACAESKGMGERLGAPIHVLGLDVEDDAQRAQLQCIARENGGLYKDARNGEAVAFNVRMLLKEALAQIEREEAARREAENKRRMTAERTRLRVTFANEIDPFFADEARLTELALDGAPLPVDPERAAQAPRESAVVLDAPVAEGPHALRARYVRVKGRRETPSETVEARIAVEHGKTAEATVAARGGLLSWKAAIAAEPPPEPAPAAAPGAGGP